MPSVGTNLDNWKEELDQMRMAMNDEIQLEIVSPPNITHYNPGVEYSSTGMICGIGKI